MQMTKETLELCLQKHLGNLEFLDRAIKADKQHFLDIYKTANLEPPGDMGAEKALALIDAKWKYAILARLFQNPCMRYSQIKHSLEYYGLADNTLSTALKELEQNGLIEKTVYPEIPVRVEYNTTDKAFELWKIILTLSQWYNKYETIAIKDKLQNIASDENI